MGKKEDLAAAKRRHPSSQSREKSDPITAEVERARRTYMVMTGRHLMPVRTEAR